MKKKFIVVMIALIVIFLIFKILNHNDKKITVPKIEDNNQIISEGNLNLINYGQYLDFELVDIKEKNGAYEYNIKIKSKNEDVIVEKLKGTVEIDFYANYKKDEIVSKKLIRIVTDNIIQNSDESYTTQGVYQEDNIYFLEINDINKLNIRMKFKSISGEVWFK